MDGHQLGRKFNFGYVDEVTEVVSDVKSVEVIEV